MRRMGIGLGWLGAVLLAVVGCKPTETRIKPPPLREEYTLPPNDDPRFTAPPVFPKEARGNGLKKPSDPTTGPPPSLRGPGSPRFGAPSAGGF